MRVIARMNVGGPAVQVLGLLCGLDADRYDQRLYTGYVADDEADRRERCTPELPAYRIATLGRRVRAGDDLRALADLVAAMPRFRPHIVHTHPAKRGRARPAGRGDLRCTGARAHVPRSLAARLLHARDDRPGDRRRTAGHAAAARLAGRRRDRLRGRRPGAAGVRQRGAADVARRGRAGRRTGGGQARRQRRRGRRDWAPRRYRGRRPDPVRGRTAARWAAPRGSAASGW
jgi:hypothetical protein